MRRTRVLAQALSRLTQGIYLVRINYTKYFVLLSDAAVLPVYYLILIILLMLLYFSLIYTYLVYTCLLTIAVDIFA